MFFYSISQLWELNDMNIRQKVVPVRAYHRVVSGQRQNVCAHKRSLPR